MPDIVIGERIVPLAKFDCYKVEIEWMHGDADAYTQEIHYFPINEEEKILELIRFLVLLEKAAGGYTDSRYQKICQEFQSSYYNSNQLSDIIPGDVTNEGTSAQFEGYSLSMYDADGIEFICFLE